jgi:hypothetical protein
MIKAKIAKINKIWISKPTPYTKTPTSQDIKNARANIFRITLIKFALGK